VPLVALVPTAVQVPEVAVADGLDEGVLEGVEDGVMEVVLVGVGEMIPDVTVMLVFWLSEETPAPRFG
jgi:hypothetical protein